MDAHVSNETIMERLWSKLLEMREMRDQGTVTAVDMIMRRNDINEKVPIFPFRARVLDQCVHSLSMFPYHVQLLYYRPPKDFSEKSMHWTKVF